MRKRLLLAAPAFVLTLGLYPAAFSQVQVGQIAPNFTLTDLSGTPHTLSQYRGKVVFLNFFGWG
jgi:cytochrome oxidase Cu insertion factor (SCO1/SenC/PrrC family)